MRPLGIGLAVLMAASFAACAVRGPVVDAGSKPVGVGGTISGIVTFSGAVPVPSRRVTAIDTTSGARYDVVTAVNGGYTIKVPTGRYRLEVELREGETLADKPADTDINTSDLDAARNFVITVKPNLQLPTSDSQD